jgi:glycosyltransferase involved in cell wall biosynthesis
VESLGLVLLEAWANQKPVIAADIAVSRELVTESGGGVIVPFGNAQQLALEIENLLGNPGLRQTMGAGGHKKALEYEGNTLWRRNAEEFERVATAGMRPQERK